ncbi:protease inhibitor Inh/omp19 family protein [Aquabacter cavernae]|uniref:protease inhibitor Inh/omp19 family protein n=1 Tax=Aquabacter cavernae TaxID=2496029 RepID=UPI000F8E517D|nr:protease inhibitor Inh/omp19 family protein [Aquabacter cavernae]
MKVHVVPAVVCVGLLLCGCSTDLDGFGTKTSAVDQARILNAPTGAVESAPIAAPGATGSIPAPSITGANAASASAAVTPSTTASAASVPLAPPPVNPGAVAYATTGTQEQLSGAWTFSWDDGSRTCPLTLSTARGVSGLSAQADISCPSEIFMTKGWDMLGPDLVLQNHVGKVTARLSPSGPNRYVGVIADNNQSVVLTR